MRSGNLSAAMVALAISAVVSISRAQERPGPAHPAHVGMEFGIGQDDQHGSFRCPCGEEITGGIGTDYSASAFFELPLATDLFVGAKTGFTKINTTSSEQAPESVVLATPDDFGSQILPIMVNHTGVFSLSLLRFEPFVQYQLFHSGVFVHLGTGLSVVLSNSFSETREMPSGTITLSDGSTINNVTFTNGTRTEQAPSAPIQGIHAIQYFALAAVGYDFDFGTMSLVPALNFNLPLSAVSTQNSVWKISSVYGSLALSFAL